MSQITKINGVPIANTSVSGFTYDGINKFTIDNTNGTSYNASISSLSASTLSGGTILSGSTNLYSIFAPFGTASGVSSVGQGSNITTGGTASNPTINVVASPSFNNVTFSGTAIGGAGQFAAVTATSLSAGTLSGGTILSGSTNLYSIFSTKDTFITGVTISSGVLTIAQNQGQSNLTASTNNTRELTFNSNDMTLNTATRATLTPLVMAITRFAGTGAVDDAGLSFSLPDDYVGSPQFNFVWRAATTSANNAKIFLDVYTGTTNNLGSLTTAAETLSITSTPTNANTFIISSAVTSNLILSGSDTMHVRIYRDPGDAGDTFTGDLDMINLNFKYNSIS